MKVKTKSLKDLKAGKFLELKTYCKGVRKGKRWGMFYIRKLRDVVDDNYQLYIDGGDWTEEQLNNISGKDPLKNDDFMEEYIHNNKLYGQFLIKY